MDRLVKPGVLTRCAKKLKVGDILDAGKLKEELISMGYEKTYQAEAAGQFAVRGGILDVFPLSEELPFRIELWGDEIDTIRSIDPESQRSVEQLQEAIIYPVTELVLSQEQMKIGLDLIEKDSEELEGKFRSQMLTEEAYRIRTQFQTLKEEMIDFGNLVAAESYLTYFYKDTVSFLDYFKEKDVCFLLDEPARLAEKGRVIEKEFSDSMEQRLSKGYLLPLQADVLFSPEEIWAKISGFRGIAMTTLDQGVEHLRISDKFDIMTKSINSYNRSVELLLQDLKQYKKKQYSGIEIGRASCRERV